MEAGNYNIVPCLFDANLEGNFSLVVYASSDFELVSELSPLTRLLRWHARTQLLEISY